MMSIDDPRLRELFDQERARQSIERGRDTNWEACKAVLRYFAGSIPERHVVSRPKARKENTKAGLLPTNVKEMVEACAAESCRRSGCSVADFGKKEHRMTRAWAWEAACFFLPQKAVGAVHGFAVPTVGNTRVLLGKTDAEEAREWAAENLKPVLSGAKAS